jgi:cytochrome c biogenesis protein CcmG/thiol:disulfide interchange protein DsbE
MRITFFSFLSLVLATSVFADEKIPMLKVGSEVYSNVTVTSVSATDIYFTYVGGMANAKLKKLDPALQKHFHYDAAGADAIEKKRAADNAQYYLQALKENVSTQTAITENSGSTERKFETPTGKKLWANSFLNQKAPDFQVEKWLTPEPDRRGKFVLIDFWATWCPPCREAIPELNGYARQFSDKLVVIGISDETEEAVRKLTNPQIEYYVAIDSQARMKNAVGVTGIPHVLLIDPQGYVRWEGFPFLEGHELNSKVVGDIIAKYSD